MHESKTSSIPELLNVLNGMVPVSLASIHPARITVNAQE